MKPLSFWQSSRPVENVSAAAARGFLAFLASIGISPPDEVWIGARVRENEMSLTFDDYAINGISDSDQVAWFYRYRGGNGYSVGDGLVVANTQGNLLALYRYFLEPVRPDLTSPEAITVQVMRVFLVQPLEPLAKVVRAFRAA